MCKLFAYITFFIYICIINVEYKKNDKKWQKKKNVLLIKSIGY